MPIFLEKDILISLIFLSDNLGNILELKIPIVLEDSFSMCKGILRSTYYYQILYIIHWGDRNLTHEDKPKGSMNK